MIAVVRDGALCALDFGDCEPRMRSLLAARFGSYELRTARNPAGVSERVRSYFAGSLDALDSIEIDMHGSPFQKRVWHALRRVPRGKTASYGEIATRIGEPRAVRAVGMANARNPIVLVVPCHRIIGSDGSLTGYGGGLERKRWLLAHEGARVARPRTFPKGSLPAINAPSCDRIAVAQVCRHPNHIADR